jgi:hypothetical protein
MGVIAIMRKSKRSNIFFIWILGSVSPGYRPGEVRNLAEAGR